MEIKKHGIYAIIPVIMIFGRCTTSQPLPTVSNVDLEKYMGKWYEIASFDHSFQRGCHCTTAEYELKDGYVKVTNSCNKESVDGEQNVATAKAYTVKGSNNSRLKVQFFWPFKGDYYIIDLADDYSYAAVGSPSRKYLWILNRTPTMDKETYNAIVERVKKLDFDVNKLQKTVQCP